MSVHWHTHSKCVNFTCKYSYKHIILYLLIWNKGMNVKIIFHMYILYIQNKYMVAKCAYEYTCTLLFNKLFLNLVYLLKGNAAKFSFFNRLFLCPRTVWYYLTLNHCFWLLLIIIQTSEWKLNVTFYSIPLNWALICSYCEKTKPPEQRRAVVAKPWMY